MKTSKELFELMNIEFNERKREGIKYLLDNLNCGGINKSDLYTLLEYVDFDELLKKEFVPYDLLTRLVDNEVISWYQVCKCCLLEQWYIDLNKTRVWWKEVLENQYISKDFVKNNIQLIFQQIKKEQEIKSFSLRQKMAILQVYKNKFFTQSDKEELAKFIINFPKEKLINDEDEYLFEKYDYDMEDLLLCEKVSPEFIKKYITLIDKHILKKTQDKEVIKEAGIDD